MQFQKLPWPLVYDSPSQRLRGFYPRLVSDQSALRKFLVELSSFKDYPNSTRISTRAVVHSSLIASIEDFNVEAIIPLDNLDSCKLVYLACNNPNRPRPSSIARQIRELKKLHSSFRVTPVNELRLQALGYELVTHSALDTRTAEQIAALFASRFSACPEGMSIANIMDMPNSSVVITAKNVATGELVVVFMGDLSFVDIEGQILRMIEFNHVVAMSGIPHQALIPLMAFLVIKETAEFSPLVFAETRADVLALQAACLTVGMQQCGTMAASFLLLDRNEKPRTPIFKNAHVWHLPEARRQQIIGELE